jgi:hypothetical protein
MVALANTVARAIVGTMSNDKLGLLTAIQTLPSSSTVTMATHTNAMTGTVSRAGL